MVHIVFNLFLTFCLQSWQTFIATFIAFQQIFKDHICYFPKQMCTELCNHFMKTSAEHYSSSVDLSKVLCWLPLSLGFNAICLAKDTIQVSAV